MMKFTAVGDTAIQRRLPKNYEGFSAVKDYIAKGDARFFNLETTVNRDCFANMESGGTWLRADPAVLRDMKEFDFNLTTFANNHCMDFSYGGMLQTIDNLNANGYIHSGMGRNLHEAAAPAYLDTANGRVALISCSADFASGAMAGVQSRRLPGRPGVNGIRIEETVIVTEEQLNVLKNIAKETKVNAQLDVERRDGYAPQLPDNVTQIKNVKFRVGEKPGMEHSVHASDRKRMEKMVREAAFQADYVLVSIHFHMATGDTQEEVPAVLREFAHYLIDCGAHAIIGHGPHLLRPVEVYKERPIFYSLGDFLLQLENCELAPEDFYEKFGLTSDNSMLELFSVRTKNFTQGLQYRPVMLESVIPYFEMEDGKLTRLEFMPIELGYGMRHSQIGLPRMAKSDDILKRFAKMSQDFGIDIRIENGIGIATW